ncbi:MAG: response regulator transcription factor [Caldilinea sp.]
MAFQRVFIADDSLAFVDSARRILALEPEVLFVGHAQSACAALEQIVTLHPDIVLLSVNLPGSDGLAFVRRVKALRDAPYVIVLALDDLEDYRTAAISAGADGFVAKTRFVVQMASAIVAIDAKLWAV